MLRASCSRCGRIVEIQKTDAYGLYGPDAGWKDVEQRLLDATTRQWRRPSDYWRGSNGAAFKQAHDPA
ncbi:MULTISPECIES: hypothetical protein [Bradyrhizobium]|uniref:hypothetical protein n=1 Tax=Bradyrhizobium TaxID=374 RepID=UPI00040B25E4|nr:MULTISPECIES: hypothetical protein [Bradyrhizobium]UFW51227.1 hypothetical protein BaraCB756_09505 [Bradyrhizobium arachidis]